MERIQSAFHRDAVQADAPHLIVEVTPTSSTMADGDIVEELHSRLHEQQMLPDQHLMDSMSMPKS